MKWLELTLETEPEYVDAVSDVFQRYSRGGIVVEQAVRPEADPDDSPIDPKSAVKVKTYVPLDESILSKEEIIRGLACLSLIHQLPPLGERVLEEEDWANAWKAHFKVQRIGPRVVIKPSWARYKSKRGDVVVALDPGMAFGTGLHTTTRMCLVELQKWVQPGQRVLDAGTGSGIQAIAAAKLGASQVVAFDNDPVAVKAASENVRRNRVKQRIEVLESSLPLPGDREWRHFDLAVANIIASVLTELARPLVERLRPGGLLIAGGILDTRLSEVVRAFETTGAELGERLRENDWCVLLVRKRKPDA